MLKYTVSDYEDMFRRCTSSEISQFAEHALAVADVLHARTRFKDFVPFKTQAALNTNMRVLSALARALKGRGLPIRRRVVVALGASVNLWNK